LAQNTLNTKLTLGSLVSQSMILSDDEEETAQRNVINGSLDKLSSRQRGLPSNRGDSINDTQISFLTKDGKLSEAKNVAHL